MTTVDLETLWNDHHLRVLYYLKKHVRNEWTSEEMLAIVYYRAVVATSNGNGARENASGWLFQIARSVMYDHYRHYRNVTVVDYDALVDRPAESVPLWRQAHSAEVAGQVRQAVSQLRDTQREVIEMRLEGMTHSEIAEVKECAEGKIKALRNRAFADLRERLAEVYAEAA